MFSQSGTISTITNMWVQNTIRACSAKDSRIFNREPNTIETRNQILWYQIILVGYQIILNGYQIVLKLGTYFAGCQSLTPAGVGSWSGGHDEGRLAEGVTTTLCTTQQVIPPGDGKICCGMTAQRPALRPDLVAATSVLRGSSVGELCLDVRSTASAAL